LQKLKELLKVNKLIFIPFLVLIDFLFKFSFKEKALINTGIIFGTFQGYNLLWVFINFIVIFILIYFYFKEKEYKTGLIFILSGAIGNFIDRILYKGVIDFIDLGFWPSFNFADVYNIIGVILIIFFIRKDYK